MNFYAIFVGVAVAFYVVFRFRKIRIERKSWVYPMFLASFPVYYWVFAIYASDFEALIHEIEVGSIFLIIAFSSYKLKNKFGMLILSAGFIAHAIYDLIHNSIFGNTGVPIWWPEFCGSVDFLIGVYIAYLVFSLKK